MKKGFTLIELLTVIVILAIILAIAVPRIMNIINDVTLNAYRSSEKNLERITATYMTLNTTPYPLKGNSVIVTLDDLKESHLIASLNDVKNPGQECDAYIEVTKRPVSYKYKAYINCGENYITAGFFGLASPLATVYGDGAWEYFRDVAKTDDGYVAVGHSNSTTKDLIDKNKGADDAVIVKYDTAGNIIWNKNYGGNRREYFFGVTTDTDGYVAVGYSLSIDGDLSGLNKGGWDAIIVKYDFNGDILWNKNYGGTSTDYFQQIITVNDGYVAVGYSSSTNGDLASLNKGGTDAIIVKYDKNGNVMWKKNYGGTRTDSFYDVISVADGYIVVGRSDSTNGDLSNLNKGGYDSIIVKYDTSGNVMWKNNYGGTRTEHFWGVSVDNSGNLIAVGRSDSINGDLTDLNKGGYDGIIVKYTSTGDVIWSRNYGGTGADYFEGVTSSNNEYIVTGYSPSTNGDLVGLNKGGTDAIIVKYDYNGNTIWNQNYGGTSTDYFYKVIPDNNDYIAVGFSASTNNDLAGMNKGGEDGIIVKYNSVGNIIWNKNFGGGPGLDYFYGVTPAEDGYIAVGHSNSAAGDLLGLNKGGYDGIIVKHDYNGNIIWKKNYGGTATDYLFRILPGHGKNYVSVGYSNSTNGDLAGFNKGGTDGMIFTFDESGNTVWHANFGGSGTDHFYHVKTVIDGYIAVGYSNSTNGDLATLNKGGYDAIIVKYDMDGNIVWNKNFGGTGTDFFRGITVASDGYVAVGYSNSTNGDLTSLNKGNYDGIIVKYDFEGNIIWKKTYGSTVADYFWDVTSIGDNYFVVGYTAGNNVDLLNLNKGGTDAIIVNYNKDGDIVWKSNYGGTSTDNFYGIKVVDNSLMAVGRSNSTNVDLIGLNKGGYDGIVVQYSLSGDILMKRNYGGGGTDVFYDITTVRDGYVAVGITASVDRDFLDKGIGYTSACTVGFKE